MRPARDFDRIASNIGIWHEYDSAVKAELYSTCLGTPRGTYLIDPIPLESEAFHELIGSNSVAGIIVTNGNHHRASAKFAEKFSVPLFGRTGAFPNNAARELKSVTDGEEICEGLRAICIQGAGQGEIALHYAPDGGIFIIGDALINFEPYGFTFLPEKYARTQRKCGDRCGNFWITKPSECFSRMARRFYPGQVNGCAVCLRAISECAVETLRGEVAH